MPTKNTPEPRMTFFNFQKWIEQYGRTSQVGVNFSYSNVPNTSPSESSAGAASFRLEVTGTLDQIERYIRDLELRSNQFLVALDSFDLVSIDNGYKAIFHGRTFFRGRAAQIQ